MKDNAMKTSLINIGFATRYARADGSSPLDREGNPRGANKILLSTHQGEEGDIIMTQQ
jgi:hypothetical protein